jgi:hypothetical protein
MKKREFLAKASDVVGTIYEDVAGVRVIESQLEVSSIEGQLHTPYKLLIVERKGKAISCFPVSENYQLILHREALSYVTGRLDVENIKYDIKFAKDVGSSARMLVITDREVDKKFVSFLIENSYNTTSALKIYFTLVVGNTLYPVSLLLRRVHVKGHMTEVEWEKVVEEIRYLPTLLEKLKTVRTSIEFISRIKDFKTVYRRKKDGNVVEEIVEIGATIYDELKAELGEYPSVYDLWVALAKKNYEKRRGLTLLVRRKIEKQLLKLFATYRKRVEAGISPSYLTV